MVSAGSKSVTNTPDISLLSRKQGSQELIANKLETTFSSTSSYHPPSSYSSANNNFDSINSESAHNSQVSAESNILRSTPNSSLLSKKQRLSQKLKANNSETTFSSTNSFSKSFANKDFDSINSESADNSQISAESNSVRSTPDSSLLSIKQPLIQKLKMNNLETTFSSMSSSFTNKSFESVNGVSNSNNSIDSGNSSTLSKKQRISKKLKTAIAFREEVEKIIKEEERKSHEDPLCISGKMTDADSKQRIYSATDEDDRSFTSVASMSSKSSHTNSVLENATQGMLRRKKEAEMSMENGKGDSISSCSQSVCSDDSSNILKLEKSTIKSLLTDLIVESESVEENFYVDASDLNSFVKYINTNVGVMIHSKDDRLIRPVPKINECFLHGHVVENLEKLRLRDMNRIQTVAYPAILARRNIAMISHLGTGKTVGYIVPLASHLSTSEYYDKLPKGFGPKILVVTPSWDSGEHVAYLFQKLCRGSTSILHCYGGGAELELRDKLLTGCDILVTTPRCLLRLLEYGFTNLDLLCHLVLDDADILLDKFKNEISKLLVAVDALEEARDQRQILVSLQIVVAARTWTRPVMELVTCILNDPVICIASQLEACVYAGIKPTAIFVQADKKVEKLVDILKEVEGKERTVVMCRTKDDVKYLYGVLIDLGVRNVIAAHEDLSGVSISEIPAFWNQNQNSCEEIWKEEASMPIMVRSDEVLEETPLTNASVLIHYNMPNSKTTFSHRLACMMQRYNNLLKKESKPKPQVFILLDEKNDLETPGVMEFMKRLGTVLPESVQCTIEEIEKTRQQKRMSEPLCETLKQFGECWDIKQCKARHTVYKELDNPDDVPRKGWVKMIVHHVHNASHFSVRLLEHAEEKDNWQRLPSNLLTLPFRLSNYFVVDKNKRMHGPPKVGDVVAVETSIDEYKRAVVLRITDYNKYKEVTNVDIQLIDNGRFDNRKVTDLFRLPDDMAKLPPSVVDMYLCAVKPKDLDTSWPTAPGRWVDEQLRQTRRQSPNGYLVGKIKFALRGSLWLDPVDYQEFLPELDTTVHLLNLRRDLLKANMATDNSNHLPALRRLCENAGIELPQEDPVVMKKVKQPHPQWAWLPVDEMEDVHIVVVENPEAIFVRQNKFNDNVDRLMKEVQEYAIAEKQPPNFDKMLDVGDCCLGKLSETEEWNRALVRSKPTEDTVELFFVDFGDTKAVPWNHVLPIPNKFITKLPFQVVECCLAGVKYFQDSDSKDWEDDVIDLIYDLSRDENEGAISLALKVCSVEGMAVYTGGRRYKVILANLNVEPDIVINSRLLSSNYAELLNEDIVSGIKTMSVGENKSNESSDSEEDKKNLDVALPNAFKTEDELKMEEILRSLEARVDDFDFGIDFTNAKDDAERSNSCWALPPADSEDLSECPSNTINPPISSLSLSEVEQLPEALSTPLTHRHLQSHLSTSAKNWNVKELMTSNILGQSGGSPLLPFAQNISPRLKELSQIPSAFQDDDLDEDPRTLQWIGCIPESDSSLDQSHINEDLSFSQVAVQSDEIRTPMVEWYQDDIFVFIQIKLPALEAYNITFDIGNVNFSAKYSGVMYQVDLTLFGAHHRDRAEHSAEAFYVEIKLEKMLKGKKRWWPRLTRTEQRLHWLKLNLEKVCPDSGSEASELEDMRIRLGYCDNRTETPTSIASSEMSELANSELSM
ncbi:putative ATP-dependent RNA helicase TDRD12 isoform X1 [Macrosteles quadrilineatus]|nr:putative ATP-dependent RNA helicase TDRD12 isoform X1 [Macrosteles quadrilineatus]